MSDSAVYSTSSVARVGKPWYTSLTVQAGIIVAVAGAVQASGPSVLEAFQITPAAAAGACRVVAQLLTDAGAGLTLIGRMRLGDLT